MDNDVLKLDVKTALVQLLRAVGRMWRKLVAQGGVTLDVDGSGLRLMETRRGMVRRWASTSFEPGGNGEEEASDGQALDTAVGQLMASSGIKSRKVTASFSGLYSVNRLLPVSSLALGLATEEAVQEEAKATLPLAGDRFHLSWQTVAVKEDERLLIILGVPRDAVNDQVKALKRAGVNPGVLELRAIALARAVNRRQALILNIEPFSLDVVLVVGNIPVIMRTVAWEPEDLALEDKLEQLLVALEMTVDFYDSHNPSNPVDASATPLFITGQMSLELALVEKLQAKSRYPVEPLTPPLDYPEHFPASQYAVNIGMALRDMPLSASGEEGGLFPVDINLLPESYRPWRPSSGQVYTFLLVAAAFALLFPVFQVAAEAMDKTSALEAKYNALNTALEKKKLEIKRREPIQKAINEYKSLVNTETNFTADLETIRGEAAELGVQVGSITHEGERVTVVCQADDYVTFREYLAALEESGRFATPIPPPEGYPYTKGGTIKLETAADE